MTRRSRVRITRRWVLPTLLGALVLVALAAAGAAVVETETVGTYWRGLFWASSLITTVGFIDEPPRTIGGAALAVGLMVVGFILLSMISAFLVSLFLEEVDAPRGARQHSTDEAILAALNRLEARMTQMEDELRARATGPPAEPGRSQNN